MKKCYYQRVSDVVHLLAAGVVVDVLHHRTAVRSLVASSSQYACIVGHATRTEWSITNTLVIRARKSSRKPPSVRGKRMTIGRRERTGSAAESDVWPRLLAIHTSYPLSCREVTN
jgi:hypothetical protein